MGKPKSIEGELVREVELAGSLRLADGALFFGAENVHN